MYLPNALNYPLIDACLGHVDYHRTIDACSGLAANHLSTCAYSTLFANCRAICADLTHASHHLKVDAYSRHSVYCLMTYAGSGPDGNRQVTYADSVCSRFHSGTGVGSLNALNPQPPGGDSLNGGNLRATCAW